MPKRPVLKVMKVNYTPSAPWMVRVPEQLQKIEAAKKKFFRRESVARAYVERLARQLGDYQHRRSACQIVKSSKRLNAPLTRGSQRELA